MSVRASCTSSRDASTTPTNASTNPAFWTVLGRSPWAKPTATGTTAEVAAIGVTMLIAPTAIAR